MQRWQLRGAPAASVRRLRDGQEFAFGCDVVRKLLIDKLATTEIGALLSEAWLI